MNMSMAITRSLTGLPSTILLILLCNPRPMSGGELVVWAASNDDDVRKATKVLGPEGLGFVAVSLRERGEKWYSLAEGAQQILPGFVALPAAGLLGKPESDLSEPGFVDGRVQPVDEPEMGENGAKMAENSPKNAPESDLSEPETGSIMIDDDSINQNKSKINHQSEPEKAKIIFPKVSVICQNLEMLFGESLATSAIPANTSAELMLAWVAKLWVDYKRPNSQLNNPLGVLVRRLKAREGRKLHLENLPDDFLVAIGIRTERKKAPSIEEMQADWDAENTRLAAEQERREKVLNSLGRQVSERWQAALEILREELPRAAFETWCSNARALADGPDGLVVGCHNDYAADWMTRKAAPLLGFAVQFVQIDAYLERAKC